MHRVPSTRFGLLTLLCLAAGCGTDSNPSNPHASDSGVGGSGDSGVGGSPEGDAAAGGSASGAGGTGGSSTGGSGTGGSGTGGSGGSEEPGGPLLELPPGSKYDCTTSRAIEPFEVPIVGQSLISGGDSPHIAIAEYDLFSNEALSRVTWSRVGVDGALGTPVVVEESEFGFISAPSVARKGDQATVIWNFSDGGSDEYALRVAQIDASGTASDPATLTTTGAGAWPSLTSASTGYALAWVDREGAANGLYFARLHEDGTLDGTPMRLVQAPNDIAVGDVVHLGDRFVVTYMDYQHYADKTPARMLWVDDGGNVIGDPVVFEDSAATGFSLATPRLLVRGDEVLAAWAVSTGDNSPEEQSAATTVRLARFDAEGQRQGPIYDLQAPVTDREAVAPRWVDMGDDVGLLWAEGSIIYICAGCVPDHSIKFVVLNGDDFTPESSVVELVNPLSSGGLLAPQAARVGDDLLVAAAITYHVSAEGASGTIRCTTD